MGNMGLYKKRGGAIVTKKEKTAKALISKNSRSA
jgi:hypothetical protein